MGVIESYARQLRQLLPPGDLWKFDADAVLPATLEAIAAEFARVHERGDQLILESDPRTADETLDDWESMLGLPDAAILVIPGTTAARQQAITQKYRAQGGQRPDYFISLAAACGYTATIDETYGTLVLRSGFLCGSRCYGDDWAYVWRMDVSPPSGTALTHTELETIIRRVAPSHTVVIFNYL